MSRKEDHYSNTEADAGRWERAHDDHDYIRIGTELVDVDDIPALSDLEWDIRR